MEDKEDQVGDKVIQRIIEDEMKASYLDYSMSVIVGRALPDVRDGLKPVHRRILYAMQQMSMFYNKPSKKCARIVGEVLGKFHPHGDTAVYDSLVRMAQEWSLRYPLIKGQGNFGSIDGDRAAAMRYTEAKLNKISEELLQDIEKKTVKFVPNFDGSLNEPAFLPAKLPNLLINGSSGIAVGMATNIPPHNLNEVVDAAIHLIDNPEAAISDLMQFVKGPDFPTGGTICGKSGIKNAFSTGRGRVLLKAKTFVEESKTRKKIIIHEIPYMVNKSQLLEEIARLVTDKKITGIADLRDESDRKGMRVVVLLKKDANEDIVLNQLLKHTRLKVTFGVIMLTLVDGQPRILNLKEIITQYILHRRFVVRKRTEFDLNKTEDRAHILEGLLVALKDIDSTIKMIKASSNADEAKSVLISRLSISEKQALAILDMRLQRLTGLEQDKIKSEHSNLLELIEKLKSILGDESRILKIIKTELAELKEKYGDERRTDIIEEEEEMVEESYIKPEEVVVTISHKGYIKRLPVTTYKAQKRGGKGVIAAGTKDEDFVENLFIANTHSYVLFFTNKGKVKWLKVYEISEASRQSKGSNIVNLLHLSEGEKINAAIPVNSFEQGYLVMATKKGTVKKTPISEFSRPRKGGIIAINLENSDELIGVKLTNGEEQVMLATSAGMAVKFNEKDVRSMGRSAKGVRGIRLKKEGDQVVGMVIADDESTLFTLTENGFGKRTKISEYRLISRGGSGVTNIVCSERNGSVVSVKEVSGEDQLMLVSQKGIGIKVNVQDISVIGRATQGVRIMKLSEGDRVAAVAKVVKEE